MIPRERISTSDTIRPFVKVFKFVCYVILFCIVLTSAVASKMCILLMSSSIVKVGIILVLYTFLFTIMVLNLPVKRIWLLPIKLSVLPIFAKEKIIINLFRPQFCHFKLSLFPIINWSYTVNNSLRNNLTFIYRYQ